MPRLAGVDIYRFLPLSNRPRDDESSVTVDRREMIADVVEEAAGLALEAGLAPADARLDDFARTADLTDARDRSPATAEDLALLADAVRTGPRRRTRSLMLAVRAVLVLGDALGLEPRLSAVTLGAVALYGTSSATFDRRAVVRGHTLRATDAEWSLGHGPVLQGTAMGIVRFLLGLSDEAPRPPAIPPR